MALQRSLCLIRLRSCYRGAARAPPQCPCPLAQALLLRRRAVGSHPESLQGEIPGIERRAEENARPGAGSCKGTQQAQLLSLEEERRPVKKRHARHDTNTMRRYVHNKTVIIFNIVFLGYTLREEAINRGPELHAYQDHHMGCRPGMLSHFKYNGRSD